MRFSTLSSISFLSAVFPLTVEALAQSGGSSHTIQKRFDNARFTFYDVGLGACGKTNVASDFIVALNEAQFGSGYPGPHCFQTITIQANGKSAEATIMDMCPGCPYGGLDFSRGLFDHFADESVGVLTGSWDFSGGSGGGDNSTSSGGGTSTGSGGGTSTGSGEGTSTGSGGGTSTGSGTGSTGDPTTSTPSNTHTSSGSGPEESGGC